MEKRISAKKRVVFGLLAALLLAGCELSPASDNSDNSENPDNPGNAKYAKQLWGEWLRMDTGDTWYITSGNITINGRASSKTISLDKQSDRVIEVTEGGRKYYLYASRVANASFTGTIAGFQGEARSARAIGGSGLGGIGVVISNLNDENDKTTTTTDSNGNFTVDEIIPGDNYVVTPEGGTPATVTPIGDGDDVGTITITNGLNFKTSIKPQSPRATYLDPTDMSRLYASINSYDMAIEIENTGTIDCTAATWALTFPDDLIPESVPASHILGTVEPGKKKTIDITIRCREIEREYEYKKIGVTITDPVSNKTWEDSVSLKFHKALVDFNIKANRRVSGIIISPTAQAYSFNYITDTSLSMPWSTKDYLVVFSGATADTEAVYSFGAGIMPDSNFDTFTDAANYEPNNAETSAEPVVIGNKIMSYLYKNDIDYYKVNMGYSAPVIKAIALVDFKYTDATGNSDGKIQPSESAYLDIMVKNNTNAVQNVTSTALSTPSPYITLNKNTGTIGVLSVGYYQTLTFKSRYNLYGGFSPNKTSIASDDGIRLLVPFQQSATFKFTVSTDCPVGTNIPFTVTFTDSWGNVWTDTLTITVQ